MGRRGQSITLSVSQRDKQQLERLALEFGLTWGDRPNISKLVEAIARQHLRIAPNHNWTGARIDALNQARLALIDGGHPSVALELGALLLERSEIPPPLRAELEQFMAKPAFPWRLAIDRHIQRQQPFRLSYQDAAQRLWQFTIYYAEIAHHEGRQYLDCWCQETDDDQDLPALAHNRCLRLDRIPEAAITPISGPWRGQLDTIAVEMHLFGGLAFAYESKKTVDQVNQWLPGPTPIRQVIRQVANTFWLLREVLRYGADCLVVAPKSVQQKVKTEMRAMVKRYEQLDGSP